jgi:hypothetical protein
MEPEDQPPNVVGPTTPILANSNNESLLSSVSTSSTTEYNQDSIVDGTIVVTPHGNVKVLNYSGEYYSVNILRKTFLWNGVNYKKDDTTDIHRSHVLFWYDKMFNE